MFLICGLLSVWVLYELISGKAVVRGSAPIPRAERPGAYWFAIALKSVAVLLFLALELARRATAGP